MEKSHASAECGGASGKFLILFWSRGSARAVKRDQKEMLGVGQSLTIWCVAVRARAHIHENSMRASHPVFRANKLR